jgi:hypothetical protein
MGVKESTVELLYMHLTSYLIVCFRKYSLHTSACMYAIKY